MGPNWLRLSRRERFIAASIRDGYLEAKDFAVLLPLSEGWT